MSLSSELAAPSREPSLLDALATITRSQGAGTNRGDGTSPVAIEVYGAVGGLGPALAAHVARTSPAQGPVLYLVARDEDVETRLLDLRFFLPPGVGADDPLAAATAVELPAPDGSPHAEMQPDRRAIMRRLALLFRLGHGFAPAVVVASAAALFRRVIPPAVLEGLCAVVRTGAQGSREDLVRRMVDAGYGRAPVVEDPGTFAVRGQVIDVFPAVYRHPVRIELDGDEIESVRLYDAATQRTLRRIDSAHVHPVRETVRTAGADVRGRLLAAADAAALPSSAIRRLLDRIDAGEDFLGIESLTPIFHARMASFFEYLPQGARLVVEEPDAVVDEARRTAARLGESALARRGGHRLALDARDFVLDEDEARGELGARARLELRLVEIENAEPAATRLRLHAQANTRLRAELLETRPSGAEDGVDMTRSLCARIAAWTGAGHRVRVVAPGRRHVERVAGVLRALGCDPHTPAAADGCDLAGLLDTQHDAAPLAVISGSLSRGFRLPGDRLILLSEEEVFGPRAHREAPPARPSGAGDLADVLAGDLVVHEEHGIGRYRGLRRLDVRGVSQDFLHLEYEGGSLYVPVYRIGLVRKYGGGPPQSARLDKLGGHTWLEKRRRVSADARKMAEELLQLYAQRRALAGHAFPPPDVLYRELEETFPFEETPDQAKAIEAVLQDMQSDTPMDRLVCGDVGYGKTEVAMRASLLAVLGGRQVALLAPTTVLCEQHLLTIRERFRELPVRVASLSRFRSGARQAETIAGLADGKVDVVIGTHRLLSRDVRWKRLGLVIIDEEHRFGVAHKERLRELRSQIDVLTLTATPIPRTLQMVMSALREISIIATPPADRLAIRTFVCHWDPALLAEAIRRELSRGGQIFFVHNRIEDLQRWRDEVQKLAPQARIGVAHGQMRESDLERAMIDFVDGHIDILCCTTIVESGLDIPRANTMIVNHADRFGLAQLYQLRGRIGRARERAFCYLVVPAEAAMTDEAKQRLAVLQRFTELGAGFQIATHDLEIRGAGELLGRRQSGALAAVGFETYARLLEEAVAELRGAPITREHDPEIAVDLPAFLPDDYIPDTGQRLDTYRRVAQARDEDEVKDILSELQDRYGPLPEEARLLGEVMIDKTLVRRIGAVGYELGPRRMALALGPEARLDPRKVLALVANSAGRWRLGEDKRLHHTFDESDQRDRLAAARRRLQEVAACAGPGRA